MDVMSKIVTKETFRREIRPALKKANKTIVLCHGVFDLMHPGHVIHFEQAKAMADVLVVSITAEQYVRKGPDRPYFNDALRMKVLSELTCIDYVMLSDGYTVDDIVESVEPDVYAKGQEYEDEDADITAAMRHERELVERHGGCVRFTKGLVFSSTKLINRGLCALPDHVIRYMERFKKKHSMDDILTYTERIEHLKTLVIGEVIIDRYTYCQVQGLMNKDAAFSARFQGMEEHLGGACAVARHIAGFCDDVILLSVVGNEPENEVRFGMGALGEVRFDSVISREFPTIVKHRYLTPNQMRIEFTKLFEIDNIPLYPRVDREALGKLKGKLEKKIKEADVVFLCDYGHGLIDDEIMELIQTQAKCLVLNCQTNASNYGRNIITKYSRADAFFLDQNELALACPKLSEEEEKALKSLCSLLNAKKGWLTRGSKGALGCDADTETDYGTGAQIEDCPAFTLTVADTLGAGDAFYAVSGLYAAAGAPLEVATVMGNIAGALGVGIVGNKQSIQKLNALKYASTLLNV